MTAPTSSAGSGRRTGARCRRVWGGGGGRRRARGGGGGGGRGGRCRGPPPAWWPPGVPMPACTRWGRWPTSAPRACCRLIVSSPGSTRSSRGMSACVRPPAPTPPGPGPLDLDAMRAALRHLAGTHEFRAFRALGTPTKTSRCALLLAELTEREDLLFLTFGADRFLRHMVRMIVGTILRVGRGTLTPQDVAALLEHGGDGVGGPAAPPHGLYLIAVGYQWAGERASRPDP